MHQYVVSSRKFTSAFEIFKYIDISVYIYICMYLVHIGNMALKLVGSLIPNDSLSYRLYGSKFHPLPFLFLVVPHSVPSSSSCDIIKFSGGIEARESILVLVLLKKSVQHGWLHEGRLQNRFKFSIRLKDSIRSINISICWKCRNYRESRKRI